jgi:regulator of sigma E protease
MTVLIAILAFVIGIGILVFVHEFGHFIMARLCGVRVEKFSIGFPPKIFSFKIGETEYTLGAIPLGGYVKMAGAIDESLDGEITGAKDEFQSKNAWQKSLILIGGVVFNILLAIALFTFLNFKFGDKEIEYTSIQTLHPQSFIKTFIPESNFKITKINNEPIRFYGQIFEKMSAHMGQSYSITYVLENGQEKTVFMPENLVLDKEFASQMNIFSTIRTTIFVDSVTPNSLAVEIGLQAGDSIRSLGDYQVRSYNELEVAKYRQVNKTIPLIIERNGILDTLSANLKADLDGKVAFGFKPGFNIDEKWFKSLIVEVDYTFTKAVSKATEESFSNVVAQINGFKMMFRGDLDPRKSLGGPIAIGQLLGEAFGQMDIYFRMVAAISMMLAFMNILPIPGLDGGQLLVVIIEGVRGKELAVNTKMTIQKIGIAFLLILMVFVISNDIGRLF